MLLLKRKKFPSFGKISCQCVQQNEVFFQINNNSFRPFHHKKKQLKIVKQLSHFLPPTPKPFLNVSKDYLHIVFLPVFINK